MSKLLNDVSVSEMLSMRESGMTNREIAANLGISYAYVLKLIGKQPTELTAQFYAERKQRGRVVATRRTRNNTSFDAPNAANSPDAELPAACLMVQNSIVELVSASHTYVVDMKDGTVEMAGVFKLNYDELGDIIAELSAIHRKLSANVRVPLEAW